MQLKFQEARSEMGWSRIWAGVMVSGSLFLNGLSADEPPGTAPAEADRTAVAVEALSRLQGMDLNRNPKIKEAVFKVLEKTRGTASFVKLVKLFKLTDQSAGLLEVALQNPGNETGVEAVRMLLANHDFPLLQTTLEGTNATAATKTAEALGNTNAREATRLLLPLLDDPKRDVALRKQVVRALAQTSDGAMALLKLAKEERLGEDVKSIASAELNRARWPELKEQAANILPLPQWKDAQALPPVADLLKMTADAANGARVFSAPAVGCSTCHQVKGQGVDFGPNLTEIGSKLGKDALYESILNPSAGISFGFEAWQLQLTSGDEAYGLIVSETAEELAVKAVGGIVTRYKKSQIKERQQMKLSIMPAGLQQAMTTQEFVDLVEYLASLKKAPGS